MHAGQPEVEIQGQTRRKAETQSQGPKVEADGFRPQTKVARLHLEADRKTHTTPCLQQTFDPTGRSDKYLLQGGV